MSDPFTVVVDHYALVYMVTKIGGDAHGRLQRLCLDLQGFNFSVKHRSGKAHLDADAVSRLLQGDEQPYVRTVDELRDDQGPLSIEDEALIRRRHLEDNAISIIEIINNFRAMRQTDLLKTVPLKIPMSAPAPSLVPTEPTLPPTLNEATDNILTEAPDTTILLHTLFSSVLNRMDSDTDVHPSIEFSQVLEDLKEPHLRTILVNQVHSCAVNDTVLLNSISHLPTLSDSPTQVHAAHTRGNAARPSARALEHQADQEARLQRQEQARTAQALRVQRRTAALAPLANQSPISTTSRPTRHQKKELLKSKKAEALDFISKMTNTDDPTLIAKQALASIADIASPLLSPQAFEKFKAKCLHIAHQLHSQQQAALLSQRTADTLTHQRTLTEPSTTRQVPRTEREERIQERTDHRLHLYDHLRTECYIDPATQVKYRIIDVQYDPINDEHTVTAAPVELPPVPRTIAIPDDPNDLAHVGNTDPSLEPTDAQLPPQSTAQVLPVVDAVELIADYLGNANQHVWPQSNQEWTAAQLNDPFCAAIRQRLEDRRRLPGHEVYDLINDDLPPNLRTAPPTNNSVASDTAVHNDTLSQNLNDDTSFNSTLSSTSTRTRRDTSYYIIKDSVLCRIVEKQRSTLLTYSQTTHSSRYVRVQVVVPQTLQASCLDYHHKHLGHPGSTRTLRTLLNNYYFPKATSIVKAHCNSCHYCLTRKAYNLVALPPIQSYDIPAAPMQQCHWDLTGPFPTSAMGNNYLLVFKDQLTKWTEIIPIPNKTVATVADALIQITSRLGTPAVLISDRGTEFTAHAMAEITRILEIKHIKTSPNNPRSNGLAENHMRTLKDMIAAYVNHTHTDWDKYAPLVAHFYNTTINSATGFTPYFMLFGREDRAPDHSATTFNQANPVRRTRTAIAQNLVTHLQIIWNHVAPKLATRTVKFNKPTITPLVFKPYKVGDYFFRKIIPRRHYRNKAEQTAYLLSSKLQPRYSGPYIVTKVLSPVNYLAVIHGKTQPVHALNMKPHHLSQRLAQPLHNQPIAPLPHLHFLGTLIDDAIDELPPNAVPPILPIAPIQPPVQLNTLPTTPTTNLPTPTIPPTNTSANTTIIMKPNTPQPNTTISTSAPSNKIPPVLSDTSTLDPFTHPKYSLYHYNKLMRREYDIDSTSSSLNFPN